MPTHKEIDEHLSERRNKLVNRFVTKNWNITDGKYFNYDNWIKNKQNSKKENSK